jgi:hypothetical protein
LERREWRVGEEGEEGGVSVWEVGERWGGRGGVGWGEELMDVVSEDER